MDTVPTLSRHFDRAVGAVGGAVLAVALVRADGIPPAAWLALPLVVVASRAPLLLPTASRENIVLGLESAILVVLGLLLPPASALVVWGTSVAVAELSGSRARETRVFNTGVSILSAGAALGVLAAFQLRSPTSPTALLATSLAATACFSVDYVVSAVSIAIQERAALRKVITVSGLPLALGCYLGVDSLGFVQVVVLDARAWTAPLLLLPFAALLWASRSWSNVRTAHWRAAVISEASAALQCASDADAVDRCLVEAVCSLVRQGGRLVTPGCADDRATVLPYAPAGRAPAELAVQARSNGEAHPDADLASLAMLVTMAEQAAERLRLVHELEHRSSHDALTGLANRSSFGRAVATEIAGGGRLAVLYGDLDGFKQVNDTYGHSAGDELLRLVGTRLHEAVRPGDLAARLGGDEFALLLRDLDPAAAVSLAEAVADRVCRSLGAPYELSVVPGAVVRVAISVGTVLAGSGEPLGTEDLLRASDAAMYAAKAAGGGRSVVGELPTSLQVPTDIDLVQPRTPAQRRSG